MHTALGLTARSFLKAWGKAEPTLPCSASPSEHQADTTEGILFRECFKLCGFAWVSLGLFRFTELAGHCKEPRPQQERFSIPSKRRYLGGLARAKLSSASLLSPWESDAQTTRASQLERLKSLQGKCSAQCSGQNGQESLQHPSHLLQAFI